MELKDEVMAQLVKYRALEDKKDRCVSFRHEDSIITVIDLKGEDASRYLQQYYTNHIMVKDIGLPCPEVSIDEVEDEAVYLCSKYIVKDSNPDWIETLDRFHEIITMPIFDALMKLHSSDCTHGDLSSSNMVLCADVHTVKFFDFKHLTEHGTKPASHECNLARLIDIYDAIGSILYILEYSCPHLFKVPPDNVLGYLRDLHTQLDPIITAVPEEGAPLTAEIIRLISQVDQTRIGDIMEHTKNLLDIEKEPSEKRQRGGASM